MSGSRAFEPSNRVISARFVAKPSAQPVTEAVCESLSGEVLKAAAFIVSSGIPAEAQL